MVQLELARKIPTAVAFADRISCFSPTATISARPIACCPPAACDWHPTRPPVILDQWHPGVGPAEPAAFTTVGTWQNNGNDMEIAGETYYWSKHLNFRKMLEVARRAQSADRARHRSDRRRPTTTARLPADSRFRRWCRCRSTSTTTATTSADRAVNSPSPRISTCAPRTGWFSDRTVCYLAAGRPVVTQRTGFEKFIPTGAGLFGFDTPDEAVDAIGTNQCRLSAPCPRRARDSGRIFRPDETARRNRGGRGDLNDGGDASSVDAAN